MFVVVEAGIETGISKLETRQIRASTTLNENGGQSAPGRISPLEMRFVESFISQTVIGMVKSLQGVGDIETVACTCGYLATGGAGTGDLRVSKKSK